MLWLIGTPQIRMCPFMLSNVPKVNTFVVKQNAEKLLMVTYNNWRMWRKENSGKGRKKCLERKRQEEKENSHPRRKGRGLLSAIQTERLAKTMLTADVTQSNHLSYSNKSQKVMNLLTVMKTKRPQILIFETQGPDNILHLKK